MRYGDLRRPTNIGRMAYTYVYAMGVAGRADATQSKNLHEQPQSGGAPA